jgi:GNAT superfamily N-acetyltransferase/ribosomal protein S27AE
MEIRPAESDDRARIEAVARDSFQSSYSLSPQQIETIVEDAFADSTLAARLDDPDAVVLVAESALDGTDTEEIHGFVDVDDGETRTIRWLHVDPEARGEGIATALIERVREDDAGRSLAARVLDDAVEGHEFLERFGLEQGGNDHVEFGGEEFAVALFTSEGGAHTPNEPTVTVPESVTVDGAERVVDRDEPIPGREAPFFALYSDESQEDPYGYFCSECGSTDVAADGLDRLECGDCGNVHLADEWDSAYL